MIKTQNCPMCGNEIATHDVTKENDLSVCIYCATMLRYNNALKLEILKDADFYLLTPDQQIELNEIVINVVNSHK